jgi:hypothetical protein
MRTGLGHGLVGPKGQVCSDHEKQVFLSKGNGANIPQPGNGYCTATAENSEL